MNLALHSRMVAGFVLANLIVAVLAALVLYNRGASPPLIQGVFLPDARELADFHLLDHHNQVFGIEDLKGRWHLVSYGFTTCPDICPTTLSQLAIVARLLQEQGDDDLRFLFYTVDHRRDTVQQLASYLPYFHPEFVGLTHLDDSDNPHLPFERDLGIMAQLAPLTGPGVDPTANEYQVSHGVNLFLINPQGQLQAIFKPRSDKPTAVRTFDPDTIVRDYLAIRSYLG